MELASKMKERDGLHLRHSRLLELVESGAGSGRVLGARVQELEHQIASLDQVILGLEQLLSNSLDETMVDDIAAAVRDAIGELPDSTPEEMDRVLHAMLHEVRLGHDRPIKLKLWLPDSGGLDGTAKKTPPDLTNQIGGVLVWHSRMVEVEQLALNGLRASQ